MPKDESKRAAEIPADDVDDAAFGRAMESLAKDEGRKIKPWPFKEVGFGEDE